MSSDTYRIVTGDQGKDLLALSREIIPPAWPEFMLHDLTAQRLVDCYQKLPQFQFILEDGAGRTVAMANSIPLRWDGAIDDLPEEGWDWALTKGLDDLASGRRPNLLCALQIVVPAEFKGRGLSSRAVRAMTANGAAHGLDTMVAPVRPNRKSDYPLTSIDRYIGWKTDNGLPYDPWMRVHARLGARIVRVCHRAMRITGTVAEWEKWTGLHFPESGPYVVPGALVPVEMDVENDFGTYIEPNVWMHHPAVKK
jgi:hypothetical protein